jgi:hypothetical protein
MSLLKRDKPNFSEIKVAVLDTGFCPRKLNFKSKNIKVYETEFMMAPFRIPCNRKTLLGRRFHGHHVLEEFLKNLESKKKISIYPIVIFDKSGQQTSKYWDKAFKKVDALQVNFVLLAAGLPLKTKRPELPYLRSQTIHFLAAGKEGVGISKQTKLFPQIHHQKENVFLIGNFYPPIKSDQRLILDSAMLNLKQTHYFFSGGHGHSELRGSSKAVATALAKAISLCDLPLKSFKQCLEKKSKTLTAIYQNNPININTF